MLKKVLIIGLMLAVSPIFAVAADDQSKKKESTSAIPPMLQETAIKSMIDVVSRQVARRYDLRPDQATTAKTMLETNATNFINKHYDDFIVLLPEAQAMRAQVIAGQDPSPEQVKALAKKLLPIYKEATDLIINENVKFHDILDDQQKKKHDKDMAKMKTDVKETTEKLTRWEKGEYKSGEFIGKSKKHGRRPAEQAQNVPEEELTPTSLGFWELYVKTFIDAFQLDKGQTTLAWSVLNDLKVKAQAYREDHQEEFNTLTQKVQQLTQAKADAKQAENLKSAQADLEKLNQPLMEMFDELKERLMAIPTDAQRKAAQETLGPDAQTSQPTTKPAEKK
jgi:hypothetical protein